MDNKYLRPNEEEILKVLDEIVDVNFEQVSRKTGKRSSILKPPKSSEDDHLSEDAQNKRKSLSSKRRVSFADKFQVMELCTGNIYDVPGKSGSGSDSTFNADSSSEAKSEITVGENIDFSHTSRVQVQISSSIDKCLVKHEQYSVSNFSRKHKRESDEEDEPNRKKLSTIQIPTSNLLPENIISPLKSVFSEFSELLYSNSHNYKGIAAEFNDSQDMELTFVQNTNSNFEDDMQRKSFIMTNKRDLAKDTNEEIQLLNSSETLMSNERSSIPKNMPEKCELKNSFTNNQSEIMNTHEYGASKELVNVICPVSVSNIPFQENKENIYVDVKNKNILITNSRHLKLKERIPLQSSHVVKHSFKPHISNLKDYNAAFVSASDIPASMPVKDYDQLPNKFHMSSLQNNEKSTYNKTCLFDCSMDLTCIVPNAQKLQDSDVLSESDTENLEKLHVSSKIYEENRIKTNISQLSELPTMEFKRPCENLNKTRLCIEDMDMTILGCNDSSNNSEKVAFDSQLKSRMLSSDIRPQTSLSSTYSGILSDNCSSSTNILNKSHEVQKCNYDSGISDILKIDKEIYISNENIFHHDRNEMDSNKVKDEFENQSDESYLNARILQNIDENKHLNLYERNGINQYALTENKKKTCSLTDTNCTIEKSYDEHPTKAYLSTSSIMDLTYNTENFSKDLSMEDHSIKSLNKTNLHPSFNQYSDKSFIMQNECNNDDGKITDMDRTPQMELTCNVSDLTDNQSKSVKRSSICDPKTRHFNSDPMELTCYAEHFEVDKSDISDINISSKFISSHSQKGIFQANVIFNNENGELVKDLSVLSGENVFRNTNVNKRFDIHNEEQSCLNDKNRFQNRVLFSSLDAKADSLQIQDHNLGNPLGLKTHYSLNNSDIESKRDDKNSCFIFSQNAEKSGFSESNQPEYKNEQHCETKKICNNVCSKSTEMLRNESLSVNVISDESDYRSKLDSISSRLNITLNDKRTQHFASDFMELTCKTQLTVDDASKNVSAARTCGDTKYFSSCGMELTCDPRNLSQSEKSEFNKEQYRIAKKVHNNDYSESTGTLQNKSLSSNVISDENDFESKLNSISSKPNITLNDNPQHFASDMELTCKTPLTEGYPSENVSFGQTCANTKYFSSCGMELTCDPGDLSNCANLQNTPSNCISNPGKTNIYSAFRENKREIHKSAQENCKPLYNSLATKSNPVKSNIEYNTDCSNNSDNFNDNLSKQTSIIKCPKNNLSITLELPNHVSSQNDQRKDIICPSASISSDLNSVMSGLDPDPVEKSYKDVDSNNKMIESAKSGIVYAIKQLKAINQASNIDDNIFKFPEVFMSLRKQPKPKTSFSCTKIELCNAVRKAIRQSYSFNYGDKELSFITEMDVRQPHPVEEHEDVRKHESTLVTPKPNPSASNLVYNPEYSENIEQFLENDTRVISLQNTFAYPEDNLQLQSSSILDNSFAKSDTNTISCKVPTTIQSRLFNQNTPIKSRLEITVENVVTPENTLKTINLCEEKLYEDVALDEVFYESIAVPVITITKPSTISSAIIDKSGMSSPVRSCETEKTVRSQSPKSVKNLLNCNSNSDSNSSNVNNNWHSAMSIVKSVIGKSQEMCNLSPLKPSHPSNVRSHSKKITRSRDVSTCQTAKDIFGKKHLSMNKSPCVRRSEKVSISACIDKTSNSLCSLSVNKSLNFENEDGCNVPKKNIEYQFENNIVTSTVDSTIPDNPGFCSGKSSSSCPLPADDLDLGKFKVGHINTVCDAIKSSDQALSQQFEVPPVLNDIYKNKGVSVDSAFQKNGNNLPFSDKQSNCISSEVYMIDSEQDLLLNEDPEEGRIDDNHFKRNSSVLPPKDEVVKKAKTWDADMDVCTTMPNNVWTASGSSEGYVEKIKTFRSLEKTFEDATEGEDCAWFFSGFEGDEAVFEIMRESSLGCYIMRVPLHLDSESSSGKRITFEHLYLGPDELDDLGLALLLQRVSADTDISPFCSDKLIDKLPKYLDAAVIAKSLVKDLNLVEIRNKVSVDNSETMPKLNVEVLNENHFSSFRLIFSINLDQYPCEKIIPDIEHVDYNHIDKEIVLNALKEVEPGEYYLHNMVNAAIVLS